MKNIESTIIEKVAEVLELQEDEVRLTNKVQDLSVVDSVALLELFVFIERTYNITLLEKEVRAIVVLQDLVDLIETKIKS